MSEEGENEVDGWRCCGAEPQDAGDYYLHGQHMEGYRLRRWIQSWELEGMQNSKCSYLMQKGLRVESQPGRTCICMIVYVIVVSGERQY